MQIGKYKLFAIETGDFGLDGGAMFGTIPKPLWQKKLAPDERNRIPMRMRALLILGGDRRLLVDCGAGEKFSDKLADIYKIDHSRYTLQKGLSLHGLTVADITDVVLSHLHFDHAGASTTKNNFGEIVPTFPNAKYYIQKAQLELARAPSERDRASFFADDFEPVVRNGQMVILDGPSEILEGISVQTSMGHTTGMQHVIINGGNGTMFYCADMIPTSAHVPLPWIMGYDMRPMVTLEEKRVVFKTAARDGWTLFFEHCPIMAAGRIKETQKGFEVEEVAL